MKKDILTPSEAMKQCEDWHKKNSSAGCIDEVKILLKREIKVSPYDIGNGKTTVIKEVSPIPILHNKGKIFLQFCGWSINLLDDGTWYWEDTTGG